MSTGDLRLGGIGAVGSGHLALGGTIYLLEFSSGTYATTGADIGIIPATFLPFDAGSYSIVGPPLGIHRSIRFGSGSYLLEMGEVVFSHDDYDGSLAALRMKVDRRNFSTAVPRVLARPMEVTTLVTNEDRWLTARREQYRS